tara:strand:+ start:290 stop:1018 length:729 start_codon:yes stop_codon:yes gene_type:complete
MATDIMAFVQFSDGTFGSFLKAGAASETVTSVPTGGTGLNQTSGIEIGQAFAGKVAVAAAVKVQTDTAQTGAYAYAYFLGADGKIIVPVQGGGYKASGIPALKKPVRMVPGITLQACFDAVADAAALASMAVYCTDGTSDVFFVKAVADTKTELVNKDGSTIGQSLTGKSILCTIPTYTAQNGLNDDGGGVGGFYLESSDGQLKGMFLPGQGTFNELNEQYSELPVRIQVRQNDSLSVMAGV